MCLDGKGKYFIASNAQIDDCLKENLLVEINKKFNVADALNESIGTLYSKDGLSHINFCLRIYSDMPADRIYYDDFGRIFTKVSGFILSNYKGICLSENCERLGSAMFCYLNEDGNIINRDYNFDITKHLDYKQVTKKEMIENIIKEIPDVPYKNYGKKWFSETHAFFLTYGDNIIFRLLNAPVKYGRKNEPSFNGTKIPKKGTKDVSREHILQEILPLINVSQYGGKVDLSQYFTPTEEEGIVSVLRVQETKIKEIDYEIFDLTEDEGVLAESGLIGALKNIENSIEIPANEDIVKEYIEDMNLELPSFSFSKGSRQPTHKNYKGLIKLPHGCNFEFEIEEGDAVEISWSNSIYETNMINLELIP